jgi:hypothetical protein
MKFLSFLFGKKDKSTNFETPKNEENVLELSRIVQEAGDDSAAEALISIAKNSTDLKKKTDAIKSCRLILQNFRVDNLLRCDALDILTAKPKSDDILAVVQALFETEYYNGCNDFNEVLISKLRKIGKPCVPAMLEALNNKGNPNDIRVRTVKVLGGIDDARAREAVRKAANDDNLNVRNIAVSALRKFGE